MSFVASRLGIALAVVLPLAGCNPIFGIKKGTPRPICVDPGGLLIDDMEDGDTTICGASGRQGTWYASGDNTSANFSFQSDLIAEGRGNSRHAMHFTGSGFTDWGAILGFNLNVDGLATKTYDASTTSGITLWMKSTAPVSVNFLIPETVLPSYGGSCGSLATDPNCSSHFAFQITAPGSAWTEYKIPFAALSQQYGGSATWNPRLLMGIQFLVQQGSAFDVWIDDLSFYHCGGANAACLPSPCNDPDFSVACPANDRSHLPAACRPAGTDCGTVASWCADRLLIEDMEDGDPSICASDGRAGQWYTVALATNTTDLTPAPGLGFTQTLIPGARGASRHAARLTGSGAALMGFGLKDGQTYDASSVDGIKFWMKSNAPVSLKVRTPATAQPTDGGECADVSYLWNCYNDFSFHISSPSSDWMEYHVPFAALRQLPVGSATWDQSRLKGLEFVAETDSTFDLWVDDISFYSCGASACLPTCTAIIPFACPASGGQPAGCWPAGTDCAAPPDVMNTAVWGSGPGDVWAVGYSNAAHTGTTLHWDGVTWSASASMTVPLLFAVWASGPNDVWAVGYGGTILHGNGSNWSLAPGGPPASLWGVWGSGPSDVWAVGGGGTIIRLQGGAWSAVPSGTTRFLDGVWGSGPNDVWVVGEGGTILRWKDAALSAVPSGTTRYLDGVWGSGPDDVWAVGDEGTILHWTGSAWSAVPSGTTRYLGGVWGSGPNDVWAVGDEGTILHWTGSVWTAVPSGTAQFLYSVWGSGPNDVWAVGEFQTLLHWDGAAWSAN